MYSAINLRNTNPAQFDTKQSYGYLFGLKKLNIFIGVNNSGKSKVLRTFFEKINTVGIVPKMGSLPNNYFRQNNSEFYKLINEMKQNYFLEPQNIFHRLIEIDDNGDAVEFIRDFMKFYEVFDIKELNSYINSPNQEYFKNLIENKLNDIKNVLLNKLNIHTPSSPNKLYIPILRGLRPLQVVEEDKSSKIKDKFSNIDNYKKRTDYDYFKHNTQNIHIYTGMNIYEDVMMLLLGTEKDRKTISEFEEFLSEHIFKEKITLIPKYQDDVLHIKKGDEDQHEIYNLGDGFQTLLSILFPLFRDREKENVVFIEEPEAHLHPEWQKLLLKSLKMFEKNQYFITTHSASFINDEDAAIYTVKRENKKSIIALVELDSNKFDILRDLGYKASDLFQSNYILWVEGPSDKIYLNYWINKTEPSLIEGEHYSIMFYGGSTFNHFIDTESDEEFGLNFLKTLNQNFGIILDSDKKGATEQFNEKKKKIEELFNNSGSFCWLTEYREIENYIPFDSFIDSVRRSYNQSNIEIAADNYTDRNTVKVNDAEPTFSSKIKIPETIFKQVQINGNGTTKGVSAIDLRKAIEEAIQLTSKQTFTLNKIKVAKTVIESEPEIIEPELLRKLHELVLAIKKANKFQD
jgi:predicted ATP-dependent endonuclease of OLD family